MLAVQPVADRYFLKSNNFGKDSQNRQKLEAFESSDKINIIEGQCSKNYADCSGGLIQIVTMLLVE